MPEPKILPPLDVNRARSLMHGFTGARVLVVGDVMLDRFIVGAVTRMSPEAPVPIVRFQSQHVGLGGAANVAHNILALGARVVLVGVIGNDAAAAELRDKLSGTGIAVDGLVEDASRRTTEKVRVVTERNQQVARIDYEDDADLDTNVERAVLDHIARLSGGVDALLVSDYLKGTVTLAVVQALLSLSTSATPLPLVIDPKTPHLASYAGATLIVPNHHEAETATHLRIRTDDEARVAARAFRARARCGAVIVTRSEHGMWLSEANEEGAVRAAAREISDVTGAGDTVVATLALALAAGAGIAEAAILANCAAGVVVGKFGPATVSSDELMAVVQHQAESRGSM